MALYINNNMMALNAARNLGTTYDALAVSTQRLSSGLRVNSAADDAAGLAVREMQRADIAVLNQGVRNAGDAISMIQTAEGALSVIDEKLIRMKELAEQASTGTYTDAQRQIMQDEYEQMAKEITRIATATDFNQAKMLDGSMSGTGMKIHFGTGNDSAEDYYYISVAAMTAEALGVNVGNTDQAVMSSQAAVTSNAGLTSEASQASLAAIADTATQGAIASRAFQAAQASVAAQVQLDSYASRASAAQGVVVGSQAAIDQVSMASVASSASQGALTGRAAVASQASIASQSSVASWASQAVMASQTAITSQASLAAYGTGGSLASRASQAVQASQASVAAQAAVASQASQGAITSRANVAGQASVAARASQGAQAAAVQVEVAERASTSGVSYASIASQASVAAQASQGAILQAQGQATSSTLAAQASQGAMTGWNVQASQAAVASQASVAAWGVTLNTQATAQTTLERVDEAIKLKDTARANLGAMQNRLENTITNLTVQAENTQAAESRISDVDVAAEMTQFTKNNILAQAATAMLAQANTLPQLALTLLGG